MDSREQTMLPIPVNKATQFGVDFPDSGENVRRTKHAAAQFGDGAVSVQLNIQKRG